MTITEDQAKMLSALACQARPHGARRWDPPGVMAAIWKVQHLDLAELMMTVGRAARDRDLETPAAIGNTSAPCWIERPVERATPPKYVPGGLCSTCGHPKQRCEAVRWADDDHEFTPFPQPSESDTIRIAEALKQEVQPMRNETTGVRHG